ncbi:MAG: diadenylate cyclase CdaA [Caldilineaceae bacterium]|nr:diadenylate cyclase CdaA [Caldilineaceae bacterium]
MNDIVAVLGRLYNWQSIIDLSLVALFFYILLRLFRGTQAVQLLRGILVIGLVIAVVTRTVELTAFSWLLRSSSLAVLVAIPVIFQPELRRALERVGRGMPFLNRRVEGATTQQMINEIVKACEQLSDNRYGALIVLEGATGLGEYIDRGTMISGEVSAELLTTIFFPKTALHDGAVLIRDGRVAAAGCVLPLTHRELLDPQLGTRHRAAIGITEQSDALAVAVSEETGAISVARNGRIIRRLDNNRLRRILTEFYDPRTTNADSEQEEVNAEQSVQTQ